jgi:hypothetical protein
MLDLRSDCEPNARHPFRLRHIALARQSHGERIESGGVRSPD